MSETQNYKLAISNLCAALAGVALIAAPFAVYMLGGAS